MDKPWDGGCSSAVRYRPRELDESSLPEGPGVYCWWLGDEPPWVGATENLREQLTDETWRPGRGRVSPFRQYIRKRGQAEGVIESGGAREVRRR
jgi:hypothetical protein